MRRHQQQRHTRQHARAKRNSHTSDSDAQESQQNDITTQHSISVNKTNQITLSHPSAQDATKMGQDIDGAGSPTNACPKSKVN
ncbi:MAG: hypothetical protein ACREOZ_05095, partial [Gloeomargaritales cyanobacterium]